MSRRLFHGQLADSMAEGDRQRAERLRLLARSLIGIVREALERDGVVRIHGFGTFRLARTRARRGINPRTGEPIEIPARNRVLFRPAKALRERVEPAHVAAVPLAEPHESREARLGGVMGDSPAAGGLPAADQERPARGYFPDRVAAAAIAEPTARVSGSAHVPSPARDGSREANLGGVMADSPSAGRIAETQSDGDTSAPAEPSTSPAANDEGTARHGRDAETGGRPVADTSAAGALPDREPGPETRGPARPETIPAGRNEPEPSAGGLPEEGAPDRDTDRERAASGGLSPGPGESRPEEAEIPVLGEPAAGEDAAPARDDRRPLILLGLLLLALLLGALGWWLWPTDEPAPVTATGSGIETQGTDTVVTDAPADGDDAGAATSAATGSAEPAGEATTTEPETETETTAAAVNDVEAGEEAGTTAATSIDEEAADPLTTADVEASGGGIAADGEAGTGDAAGQVTAGAETGASTDAEVATAEADSAPAAADGAGGAVTAEAPWFSGREHVVTRGETLWGLADRHYVNPYYWPHIWNHNESLANPDVIEIDQRLWLPVLEGTPRELTAADRRSIAEGYLRLYRLWRETGAANPQYALVGVRYFDPEVMPPELHDDPAAGRPRDALAAAFEAMLQAEFPIQR